MAVSTRWTRKDCQGFYPMPRHDHTAVHVNDLMIVFGGTRKGCIDTQCFSTVHIYHTARNRWLCPSVSGDIPQCLESAATVCDGTRILLFGGRDTSDRPQVPGSLYELKLSNWTWKNFRPRAAMNNVYPLSRFGHSFTLYGNKAYLYGGTLNRRSDERPSLRERCDMFTLELAEDSSEMVWDRPATQGQRPGPNAYHTCVAHTDQDGSRPRLIVCGGLHLWRKCCLWQLDIGTMTWTEPVVPEVLRPGALWKHSATVFGSCMIVFGGWTLEPGREWSWSRYDLGFNCTNSVACLNLDTMEWEPVTVREKDVSCPRARGGHCAVAINGRLYIWSGQDEYRKKGSQQVCFKDLWYLDIETSPASSRVSCGQGQMQQPEP